MFRAETNGKLLTESLFWETSKDRERFPPAFTLKEEEHEGCPSMKKIYMEMEDPSEYNFAIAVLGSYEHWERLCGCTWFKPYLKQWRNELDRRMKAKAIEEAKALMKHPKAPAAVKLSAAKYLAEKGWETKSFKGRPKKADVERAAKEEAQRAAVFSEDYDRILGESTNGRH